MRERRAMTHGGMRSSTHKKEELGRLIRAISATAVRPFLVTLNQSPRGRTELNVHFARDRLRAPSIGTKTTPRLIGRKLAHEASAAGLGVAIRVKCHSR